MSIAVDILAPLAFLVLAGVMVRHAIRRDPPRYQRPPDEGEYKTGCCGTGCCGTDPFGLPLGARLGGAA